MLDIAFFELLAGVAHAVERMMHVHTSKCPVHMKKQGRCQPEDIFNELLFPFTRSHYACPFVSFVWHHHCIPRFSDIVDFIVFLVSRCKLSAEELSATYACFEYSIERGQLHMSIVNVRRLLMVHRSI